MALTVTRSIADVLLTGINDYMELTTDSVVLTPGVEAVNTINFGFGMNAGEQFQLRWLGTTHVFTIASPATGVNELPPFSNSGEFAAFAHALESNFYIFQDFEMAITSSSAPFELTLTAREVGSRFNIDELASLLSTLTTPGTDAELASNFSVLANLYAEIEGTLELVTPIDASADEDGKVRLYVGEILKSLITPSLPKTLISGTAIDRFIRIANESLLKYYMLYYEQYGNPPQVSAANSWGASDNLKEAISFKLPTLEIPSNTAYNDHCLATVNRELFRSDHERRMKPGHVDFLQCYAKVFSANLIQWFVNYYWVEGGQDTGVPTFGYINGDANATGRVIECAITYDALKQYADLQNKTISVVQIYAQGITIEGPMTSRWYTYRMDDEWSEFTHTFLFLNSKGAWETIYFTGHIRRKKQYERVEAQLMGRDEYIKTDSEIYTYNHNVMCDFEMSTGMLYPDEVANLDEIANSERVYILDGTWGDSQAFWRPVILDPSGFSTLESSEGGLESRLFTFRNANISEC